MPTDADPIVRLLIESAAKEREHSSRERREATAAQVGATQDLGRRIDRQTAVLGIVVIVAMVVQLAGSTGVGSSFEWLGAKFSTEGRAAQIARDTGAAEEADAAP